MKPRTTPARGWKAKEALIKKGAALYASERYYDVIRNSREGLKLFPSIQLLELEGMAYLNLGRHADAARCFEAILRQVPNNITVRKNLAAAFLNAKAFVDCLDCFGKISRNTLVRDSRLTITKATALRETGRPRKALDCLNAYSGKDMDNTERIAFLDIMSRCFKDLGDYGAAAENLKECFHLSGNDPKYFWRMIDLPNRFISDNEKSLAHEIVPRERSLADIPESLLKILVKTTGWDRDYERSAQCILELNRRRLEADTARPGEANDALDLVMMKEKMRALDERSFTPRGPAVLLILAPSTSGKSTLELILSRDARFVPRFEGCNFRELQRVADHVENKKNVADLVRDIFLIEESEIQGRDGCIIGTRPSYINHVPDFLSVGVNLFIVFIEKDTRMLAVDIFSKQYQQGNNYSFRFSETEKYIEDYYCAGALIEAAQPARFLRVGQAEIRQNTASVVEQIFDLLGIDMIPETIDTPVAKNIEVDEAKYEYLYDYFKSYGG
jgi:tetratricopeptide (TPR) repeat protein